MSKEGDQLGNEGQLKEGEMLDQQISAYHKSMVAARELGRLVGASIVAPEQVAQTFQLLNDDPYLKEIFLLAAKQALLFPGSQAETGQQVDEKRVRRSIRRLQFSQTVLQRSEKLVAFDYGLIRRTMIMKAKLRSVEKKIQKLKSIDSTDPFTDVSAILLAVEESHAILNELTTTERATGSKQLHKFAGQLREKMRKVEEALSQKAESSSTDHKFSEALKKLSLFNRHHL